MNRTWIMLSLLVSSSVFAFANAPVQRIDIVNNLWNELAGGDGGQTRTSVKIELDNGDASPCFTKIMPFQSNITVYAGIGQLCVNKVVAITITPDSGPGTLEPSYNPPATPTAIDSDLYLTQIAISQDTAPVYDVINGSLVTMGTVLTSVVDN